MSKQETVYLQAPIKTKHLKCGCDKVIDGLGWSHLFVTRKCYRHYKRFTKVTEGSS